ncbi:MAG: PAS domain S-box protein, partial [Anaerolineae bacterium]|nr:PAS domain S-box protein [Anaerolineae bacterium]
VARAARTRKSVMVNDVNAVEDHMPNILLPHTQSEVAVPIIFHGNLLGVFDVQSDRKDNFAEGDLDAYRILAGQFANALYSATLFEQQSQTAAELRQSVLKTRAVFNTMTEGILVTDMMGNILDLNVSATKVFGYDDADALLNRNISELVTRPSLTRLAENLRLAMEQGTNTRIDEFAMVRKDGSVFEAELSTTLLREVETNPIGLVLIISDVTEQKRISRDIARFQALAENAVDAIVMADLSGIIDFANESCYTLFGYDKTQEDMLGNRLFSLWPDDAMSLLINEVLPLAGDQGWQGEILQVRKDKTTFDAAVTCFSVKSESGQAICLAAIIRDITLRKKAEYDLQRFAIQMSTAVSVSTRVNTILDPTLLLEEVVPLVQDRFDLYYVHVYTFDKHGKYLIMRKGSGETGQKMREQGHRIDITCEHSLVAKAARTQGIIKVDDVTKEMDFLPNPLLPNTRSEVAIPMVVAGQVVGVFDVQDDTPYRFTSSEVDVLNTLAAQTATSFRNARSFEEIQIAAKRLRELDRLKSEFLSNMSHELRTPLNSILGYAEVLQMGIDGELSDLMKEDVDAIYDNGQQLLSLINDILDLTKIEAGEMTLHIQPVDVVPLIESAKTNNIGLLLKRKVPVKITLVHSENLPCIAADRVRIAQILNNLVANAIKFTDKGQITISAEVDNQGDYVCIAVSDTGIGIAKHDLPKLFERFRQVDGSTTRKAQGTGLGLSISKHLVDLHGGKLSVESVINKGSTFRVAIPVYR